MTLMTAGSDETARLSRQFLQRNFSAGHIIDDSDSESEGKSTKRLLTEMQQEMRKLREDRETSRVDRPTGAVGAEGGGGLGVAALLA